MKQFLTLIFVIFLAGEPALPQQTPPPTRPPAAPQQRQGAAFEVLEYGVEFQADSRLIVVMAALEAAGFNPLPAGSQPSAFRAKLRRDQQDLDPELRNRLRTFYERNLLPAPATAADQASRYVSLALALSPAPNFEAPEKSDDLPSGLLEVLDFAPLVREFYRRSGIDEKLVEYVRSYQAEGDRLRQPTTEMVRALLTYLHTRPITFSLERVEVKTPSTKKKDQKSYSVRQKDRRFFILPDLLAPRGAINFRVITDDYYAIVPQGTDPGSSELRRAYFQYVVDALVLRFNREVATRREQIRQLIDERQKAGSQVSPDVFLTVSRSFVAAADARYDEMRRLEALTRTGRSRLVAAKDEKAKLAISKEVQSESKAIQDETIARLAEEYERGAVLSFFFSDQLKGIESAGFDVANFFSDMISTFDAAREGRRLAENAEARQRAVAAREQRLAARRLESESSAALESANQKSAALVRELSAIEDILRLKDYKDAEVKLKSLLSNFPGEPRVFFALGQTSSLAAADATDEQVRDERLGRALTNYRLAVQAASPETDKMILSRSHEAMGRIHAFLENKDEALKHFDEAIRLGEVSGGAYKEAMDGKRRLTQP
jgi:hypothetical protein